MGGFLNRSNLRCEADMCLTVSRIQYRNILRLRHTDVYIVTMNLITVNSLFCLRPWPLAQIVPLEWLFGLSPEFQSKMLPRVTSQVRLRANTFTISTVGTRGCCDVRACTEEKK